MSAVHPSLNHRTPVFTLLLSQRDLELRSIIDRANANLEKNEKSRKASKTHPTSRQVIRAPLGLYSAFALCRTCYSSLQVNTRFGVTKHTSSCHVVQIFLFYLHSSFCGIRVFLPSPLRKLESGCLTTTDKKSDVENSFHVFGVRPPLLAYGFAAGGSRRQQHSNSCYHCATRGLCCQL